MVDRLLEMAEMLVQEYPRSGAAKRRAVSTAYYAVFHEIADTCAEELFRDSDVNSPEYERVYRALDHASLNAQGPLNRIPTLREIGRSIATLQNERMKADYKPPTKNLFSRAETRELIELARDTVRRIGSLRPEDRRVMAIRLLFKERR
jgi:uncharacterized protein (UPF0332 family)